MMKLARITACPQRQLSSGAASTVSLADHSSPNLTETSKTETSSAASERSQSIPFSHTTLLGEIPFFTSTFDIHSVFAALSTDGAISVPLLTESTRRSLLQAAEQFCYVPEVKTVGAVDQIVRTEYSAFELSNQALFLEFQCAFQALLDREFAKLDRYPFNSKLEFNAMVLQRYLPGELGITPHRDSLRAIHLIALINLGGVAEFYRCDDRQGTNSISLDTTPGNAILMRSPGFLNASVRPFHYLTNIRSTRYSLGLRQRSDLT